MKDVSKYDLQQPHSIEYERQRHLAHWLLESGPHMPKLSNDTEKSSGSKKKKKSGGSTTPIVFCLNRLSSNTSSLSKAPPVFSGSQSNLPLQITVTARDGHKAKIRRFNSHDTSANMFSVADFENARLARRNELENAMLMKQKNRYKMNSLSSGGDYSTADSKGSKFSNESVFDPIPVELFLEKYPLPRVVRLSYEENTHTDTIASFSSTESNTNKAKHPDKAGNGENFLLYRQLKDHKVYHVMNAKASSNRKRGLKISQDFQGYFSFVNERGHPTATSYSTIVQLVRERVYKFLSVDSLTAYSESPASDKGLNKSHYVKGTAKAGQVFRLLAVFQDGSQEKSTYSSQKDSLGGGGSREKERGRYAQLVGENRQIIYVSLSSKGKFYEIEHQTPVLIQQYNSAGKNSNRSVLKSVNQDCVHKISNIIMPDTELPITLKYIAGPVGHSIVPETISVYRVSRENSLITCPIDESAEEKGLLQLRKLPITGNMKLVKSLLGFENEQRMFSNPNIQNIFKFCQFNADNFARAVEQENLPPQYAGGTTRVKGEGLRIRNPLNFLLKHDKSTSSSGHEKEDSIIFLSKNDLENMEPTAATQDSLFQPSAPAKKRWFQHLKPKPGSFSHLNIGSKRDSLDRYQDMSKLIQERFGEGPSNTSPPRPSSEIGYKNTMSDTDTIQKSFSLQELDFGGGVVSKTPDIVSDSRDRPQQPFISQKLYHEFHVKTRHSKSSSSLHQLIRKQKAAAAAEKEKFPFEIKFEQKDFPETSMFEPHERQDDCSLTVLDDLPYSSVRDSIIMQEEQSESHETSSAGTPNASENIYAEIFNHESPANGTTTVQVEERDVPNFHRISEINNSTRIRISLFNDDPNQNFTAKI